MSSEPDGQLGNQPGSRSSFVPSILARLETFQAAWTDRRLRIAVCTAIFMLGVSLRMTLVMVGQTYKESTRLAEPVNIARSLYRTGNYADPFREPTGPTAHAPPFYPFLLSLLYRLVGDNQSAEILKRGLSSAVSSLVFALLPLLARPLGMPVMAGLLAGLAGALSPLSFDTETSGSFETPWIVLCLALLTSITLRYYQAGCDRASTALWHGLAWGAALLVSPVFLPALAGFLLAGLLGSPVSRALFVRRALLTVAVAALVTIPWTIRNYVRLGALIPLRSNFPLEFHISNNDEARVTFESNYRSGSFRQFHPSHNPAEAQRIREIGEAAYNKALLSQAVGWVRAHPRRFLSLTAQRALAFWFPVSRTLAKTVLFWCLPPAALLGLWRLARTAPLAARLLGSLLIFYPLTYYLVQTSHRYRYPLDWLLVLLALPALLSSRLGRPLESSPPDPGADARRPPAPKPKSVLTTHPKRQHPLWRERTECLPGWEHHVTRMWRNPEACSLWTDLRWGWRLFRARRLYRAVVTGSERPALIFALLQQAASRRAPHLFIECLWNLPPSPWKRWGKRLLFRTVIGSASRVVVFERKQIAAYSRMLGVPSEKFVFLPSHTTLYQGRYAVQEGDYVFSGGDTNRDYATLIEAARGLPCRLVIVTRFPERLRLLRPPENVELLGAMSEDQFNSRMAASRLVVVPLRGGVLEPGGRQVFENAMALGKAVVVADDSGAGDYLEHMVSGILVPSGDVAALRQAVQTLLHDPSLARALAANAREAAKAFTPERFFAQVFALADACLKEPGR